MNGNPLQSLIGDLTTTFAQFVFACTLAPCLLVQASNDSTQALKIATVAENQSMEVSAKVAALNKIADENPDSDVGRSALLLACAFELQPSANVDGQKTLATLKNLGRSTLGTWQEGIAMITLLNALHVNGHAEEARRFGIHLLRNDIDQKLVVAGEHLTPELTRAFKFDAQAYLNMVREIVRISEANLGIDMDPRKTDQTPPTSSAAFPSTQSITPPKSEPTSENHKASAPQQSQESTGGGPKSGQKTHSLDWKTIAALTLVLAFALLLVIRKWKQ